MLQNTFPEFYITLQINRSYKNCVTNKKKKTRIINDKSEIYSVSIFH